MRLLFECWLFWYTLCFEKNQTLKAYRLTRFDGLKLMISNGLWSASLFFVFGSPNYGLIVPITFGMGIIHVIVAWPFGTKVNAFIKSRFSDNYLRTRLRTWIDDMKDREEFMEELYLFERAVFDKWVADGGLEREKAESFEKKRKRKEEYDKLKDEFKSAWYETWEFMKKKFEESTSGLKQEEAKSSYYRFSEEQRSNVPEDDERVESPVTWALKIMELPTNTTDPKTIRSQYRFLMKRHHPDVGGTEENCKKLIDANAILSGVFEKKAG